MYAVTTRRLPAGRSSANLTPHTHLMSKELRPANWQGEMWEWGSMVSRLQRRAVDILRNDPEVTAVTVLEW